MPNNPTNKITSEELEKFDKGDRTIFKADILENGIPNSQENYRYARNTYEELIQTKKRHHYPDGEIARHKKIKENEEYLKKLCMPYLNEWGAKILSDAGIDISTNSEIKPFPCKPGTKWEEVKITLIENEAVRIETPQGSGRFSYHELGMSDKRSANKPTMLWGLFKIFAQNQGYLSPARDEYIPRLADTSKRLNKHLQKFFDIPESIFTDHYKAENGYRTKIFFSDQTQQVT